MKRRLDPGRPGQITKLVKSLAGQQDQIVKRCGDEAAEPRHRRRGMGRQDDRDGRAGNDLGALLAQHRRQPVGLARFEQRDAPSVQGAGHNSRHVIAHSTKARFGCFGGGDGNQMILRTAI